MDVRKIKKMQQRSRTIIHANDCNSDANDARATAVAEYNLHLQAPQHNTASVEDHSGSAGSYQKLANDSIGVGHDPPTAATNVTRVAECS